MHFLGEKTTTQIKVFSQHSHHIKEGVANHVKVIIAIEVPLKCLHHQLWGEHLVPMSSQVAYKVDKISQTKVLAKLWLSHEAGIGRAETHNHFQVFLEFWRRVVGRGAETALCKGLQILVGGLWAEQTHCTVRLGCIQHMVGDGHKGDLFLVKMGM